MPLVVPQLKTITLGGAVTGLGIESTLAAQRHAARVGAGDGDPHRRRPGGHRRARRRACRSYRGFPNSYGTLGYALSLTIELEPVKPFVHLRHFRFSRPEACMAADRADRGGRQLPRPPGRLRRRHRVQPGRDVPHGRRVQRRGALAQRLHRRADLLPVGARPARGLPHHPRLPVALGHRLVLVLAPVRRAAAADPQALAAPLPPLRRLPHAGRASTAGTGCTATLDARRGRPPREEVIQDVEIPVDRGAEFLRFFAAEVGMSPGLAVPAAAARRRRPGRCTRCEPGEVYVNFGFWGTVALPPGRADGYYNRQIEEQVTRARRAQGAVLDVVLLRG